MTWTHFWDMNSGGTLKVPPYSFISIELPQKEAIEYFEKRFDQNPLWTYCDCCGENYDISESEDTSDSENHKDELIISKEDMKK